MITEKKEFLILGGGPAGLGVGYFAKKAGMSFKIFEGSMQVGGNCITLQHGEFRYDSGAHRFHNKDPEITEEILNLLGDDLPQIEVGSQIFHNGRFIDFPLSPLNLISRLGAASFFQASIDLLRSRLSPKKNDDSFETFALYTYGKTIAEKFLLNYSQKLWGAPCSQLSVDIAGKRLKGLDVRTFIKETFLGKKAKTEHLENTTFYYPKGGYGTISERIARFCGNDNIHFNSKITKVVHDNKRITNIEINGEEDLIVNEREVVSTLPLSFFLKMLQPTPPDEIISIADSLHYRHMLLVALFLDKESITDNATIYFPDPDCIFTRGYEPRNRCRSMSPEGKTSIVLEIPAHIDDENWKKGDDELIDLVSKQLAGYGLIKEDEVTSSLVHRIKFAYPILEVGFQQKVEQIFEYLDRFKNLKLSGRNGKYVYSWLHDMMRFGKEIVDEHSLVDSTEVEMAP